MATGTGYCDSDFHREIEPIVRARQEALSNHDEVTHEILYWEIMVRCRLEVKLRMDALLREAKNPPIDPATYPPDPDEGTTMDWGKVVERELAEASLLLIRAAAMSVCWCA